MNEKGKNDVSSQKILRNTADALLGMLDTRSRDIVNRRYGLSSGEPETLDSIGKEYGITRERVRQIEAQAKKLLGKRQDVLAQSAAILNDIFATYGGIVTEEFLNQLLKDEQTGDPKQALIGFMLDILPDFELVNRSELFLPHWQQEQLRNRQAEIAVKAAIEILKNKNDALSENILWVEVRKTAVNDEAALPDQHLLSIMEASKGLKKTVFGEWGLTEWVQTSPRGVGDKAYVILRRYNKPAHFREITRMINEVNFDHKRAHEQTVHNELIKDERFVLVGRGLYGLTDWGYIPGTVADVLESILSEAPGPMSKEDLLNEVLKQRMVKKTTVLLGLQNNKRFTKIDQNRYALKK